MVVATFTNVIHEFVINTFQSLAGFLGRCDILAWLDLAPPWCCFNPWRVFLVVATLRPRHRARFWICFNPWRVFLVVATLLDLRLFIHYTSGVSIPGGFSWSLRRQIPIGSSLEHIRFQSLAGFLGRCDNVLIRLADLHLGVVSIPGGFSWSLRRCRLGGHSDGLQRFNPWRVFLVVAT